MIANFTLHSYMTLQYYDVIFSFFQCQSNFIYTVYIHMYMNSSSDILYNILKLLS